MLPCPLSVLFRSYKLDSTSLGLSNIRWRYSQLPNLYRACPHQIYFSTSHLCYFSRLGDAATVQIQSIQNFVSTRNIITFYKIRLDLGRYQRKTISSFLFHLFICRKHRGRGLYLKSMRLFGRFTFILRPEIKRYRFVTNTRRRSSLTDSNFKWP